MNKKIIASLFFVGLFTVITGCDDSSKPSETVKQAEEKAQQLKTEGEQRANELADDTKNKAEELKQSASQLGQDVKTDSINKADEIATDVKEKTESLKAENDAKTDQK